MVVSSHGKLAILRVMAQLEEDGDDLGGCAGLVDRDFDHWIQDARVPIPENVFMTELYDRDADLLLHGGLLDAYLEATLDRAKVEARLAVSNPSELRSLITSIAAMIGRLRWASVRDGLKLELSGFPIDKAIDDMAVINGATVIALAIHRTKNCEFDEHAILDAYSKPTPTNEDQEFCCSHDLIRALTATSKWWAIRVVRRGEIETFVAGALRCDLLDRFPWFNYLHDWSEGRGPSTLDLHLIVCRIKFHLPPLLQPPLTFGTRPSPLRLGSLPAARVRWACVGANVARRSQKKNVSGSAPPLTIVLGYGLSS